MTSKEYPKFFLNLKRYPPKERKRFIDNTIESLGYQINRIPIFDDKGKEKWIIVVKHGELTLFNDSSQKFSLEKAIKYSRKIALEHYDFERRLGL